MIVLKPIGGLGNQMFQAAYAYSLKEILGKEKFIVDLSAYKTYKIREFSLESLKINDYFEISEEKNQKMIMTTNFYRCYQKAIKIVFSSDIIGVKNFNFFCKLNMIYNFDRYFYELELEKINRRKDLMIYGYFQSIKYFENIQDDIKEKMRVQIEPSQKEKEVQKKINKANNSVAISIRIGDDYTQSKELNICDEKYFKNAILKIESEVEEINYFIFSDDIQKVKKDMSYIFKDKNVYFIEGFKDYESLRLMYTCKHFIISNSSFSWWGAYLSRNKAKKIIAPKKWYNNSKSMPNIYYEGMTLIDV